MRDTAEHHWGQDPPGARATALHLELIDRDGEDTVGPERRGRDQEPALLCPGQVVGEVPKALEEDYVDAVQRLAERLAAKLGLQRKLRHAGRQRDEADAGPAGLLVRLEQRAARLGNGHVWGAESRANGDASTHGGQRDGGQRETSVTLALGGRCRWHGRRRGREP